MTWEGKSVGKSVAFISGMCSLVFFNKEMKWKRQLFTTIPFGTDLAALTTYAGNSGESY